MLQRWTERSTMWSYLFNVRIRVPISNRIPKFLCLCKGSPPEGESSFNSFACKWNFFFLCDKMTEYWDTVVFPDVNSKAEKQIFQTAEECLRVCVRAYAEGKKDHYAPIQSPHFLHNSAFCLDFYRKSLHLSSDWILSPAPNLYIWFPRGSMKFFLESQNLSPPNRLLPPPWQVESHSSLTYNKCLYPGTILAFTSLNF